MSYLRQPCILGGADEHMSDRGGGVPNPPHRRVDVRRVDPGLQIRQRQQHRQP